LGRKDPSLKLLRMGGTAKSPASGLSVAWSQVKRQVWIDMATAKMPENRDQNVGPWGRETVPGGV